MSWIWNRQVPKSTKFEVWLRLHPWCDTYRVAVIGHPTGASWKVGIPMLGEDIPGGRIAEFIRAGVEVHITEEIPAIKATHTFDEWWDLIGIHKMPKHDQPPEHASIARLAWDAAKEMDSER